ncbi:DUF3099 domain-containing protein [Actinomadura sp. PM05-2]|uniref:DUF3099 domain-containing protein n=2 Tax=Actinomadura parmotrematis TaxID=2864039 RepID=A0ABS7FSF8_9ACTN|nr:DUF3099 domain-containing protein [Actinomadura parmotrematis]
MERRKVAYAVMMGTCLILFVLAGTVVVHFSTAAALVMALVAMVLPPLAAIVANRGWQRRD